MPKAYLIGESTILSPLKLSTSPIVVSRGETGKAAPNYESIDLAYIIQLFKTIPNFRHINSGWSLAYFKSCPLITSLLHLRDEYFQFTDTHLLCCGPSAITSVPSWLYKYFPHFIQTDVFLFHCSVFNPLPAKQLSFKTCTWSCIMMCLKAACDAGHVDIVLSILEAAHNELAIQRDLIVECFIMTCKNGHLRIANILSEKFIMTSEEMAAKGNLACRLACHFGQLQIVEFLHRQGLSKYDFKDSRAVVHAALGGHLQVVQYLHQSVGLVRDDIHECDVTVLQRAMRLGHWPVTAYLKRRVGIGERSAAVKMVTGIVNLGVIYFGLCILSGTTGNALIAVVCIFWCIMLAGLLSVPKVHIPYAGYV